MATSSKRAIQHVYQERGETERSLSCEPPDPDPVRIPSIADLMPVTQIMSREMSCASPNLDLASLADLMVRNHFGCIPVVDDRGVPTGMVTKEDLIERLVARDADVPEPAPHVTEDVMMPLAITLTVHASVAQAAALMADEDVHHLAIVDDDGLLIGIVSTMDIVRWLAANDGFTAM